MKKDIEDQIAEFELEENPEIRALQAYRISLNLWNHGECESSRIFAQQSIDYSIQIGNRAYEANGKHSMGISYAMQGNNSQAKDYLEEALAILLELEDESGILNCTTNLSTIEGLLGNFSLALDYGFSAVVLAERLHRPFDLATTYNSISIIYSNLQDIPNALIYSKKALKLWVSESNIEEMGTAFNNLANLYKMQGDYALAKGYYKRARRIFERVQNKKNLIEIYTNLASLAKNHQNYKEALEFYEEALSISREHNLKTNIIKILTDMGKVYVATSKFKYAEESFNEALDLVDQVQDLDVQINFYRTFAEYCKLIGNHNLAYTYLDKYIDLKEAVFTANHASEIARLQAKFDYERQKNEAELYRIRNVELLELNNNIEQQKEELVDLNNSKDAILNVVSHDIRNAISNIYYLVQMINEEVLSPKLQHYNNLIELSSNRALTMVTDILEAHRLDIDDFSLELELLDLNKLLKDNADIFKIMASRKDISFKISYSAVPLPALMNADKMWQIVNNLVSNALKFTPSGGKIKISLSSIKEKESHICLSVKDSGIGIPPENLTKIFDRFTTVRRRGTSGEKTFGLGLSIVKRLVELHHGKIEVKSRINKGTEIKVKIPCYES